MSTYEFPKHPDAELVASQRRATEYLAKVFPKYPPTIYGRLTFKREPSDAESALALVHKFSMRISGRLHTRVLWWAVAERGDVNNRLRCHVFFWCDSPLDPKRIWLFDVYWKHGNTELKPYIKNGGAEWYMAHKFTHAEDRSWSISTNLSRRFRRVMKRDAA